MKKAIATALFLLSIPLSVLANTGNFKEGKDYDVLPASFVKSSEPTLTEVYSVYCDNCYRWENEAIDGIKLRMSEQGIEFKQKHIAFVADYGDKVSEAIAVAEATDKATAVKGAMFEAIHVDKIGDWKTDKQFYATLAEAGMTEKEVEQGLASPAVQQMLAKWDMYEKAVPSVPSFVVNGKYIINMNNLESFDQFYQLIDHLLEK